MYKNNHSKYLICIDKLGQVPIGRVEIIKNV